MTVPTAPSVLRHMWRRVHKGIRHLPIHLGIVLVCAIWLVPTLGVLISSFRPANQVATTGWWTALGSPIRFTVENYRHVLGVRNLDQAFLNSLLITVPATVVPLVIAAFAGFALARMKFRGRQSMFALIVGLLVVPIQVTLVPVLRMLNGLDLTGTFVGIWLVHAGFTMPFAVYLLRNFFASVPKDMFEAAAIDGASDLQIFFRIAVPTSTPALAALAIFQFLWVWNDLLSALIFLGGTESVAPLTVVVSNLVSSRGEGWQNLTAAAFISMALPLGVFLAFQKYFVRGILTGSVKG